MNTLTKTITLLCIATLLLAACAPAAAPATTAPAPTQAQEQPTTAPQPTEAQAATTAPEPTKAAEATTAPMAGTIPVEDGATIVFSGWGDETEQKVYKDSIDRFNKLYPNVKVDYQPIPTNFQDKLKAAMAGGTAPDAFYVDDQLMAA